MTWTTFYLICFVVGLVFSLFSLLGCFGQVHLPARIHLPHFYGHHIGPGHGPLAHPHLAGGSHTARSGVAQHSGQTADGSQASPYNFFSIMVFLAWFGGTGYLLTSFSNLWTAVIFAIALAGGFAAAMTVFLFLVKVLLAHQVELDPADFDLIGVLGKVNVQIRVGGTGEILFSQDGSRHAAGARSEDGKPIAKGTEVVITRCEKGIVYVRPYADMVGEPGQGADIPEQTRE